MNFNPFSLEGKTVLVTGASSGIGRAVAIACSKMGARVVLTGRNEVELHNTLLQLESFSAGIHQIVVADLTNDKDLERLVEEVPALDGFVANAGIMKLTLISHLTAVEMERIYRINLIAPMLLLRLLLKKKKLGKGASVVFTASAAGVYRVSIGNGIYASAKAALDAFMRTAALELGSKGIRVNSVNPGMVETSLIHAGQFAVEEMEKEKKNYPLGRFAMPEEVAWGVVYLLSAASSFVTGTSLKIDGGLTLK